MRGGGLELRLGLGGGGGGGAGAGGVAGALVEGEVWHFVVVVVDYSSVPLRRRHAIVCDVSRGGVCRTVDQLINQSINQPLSNRDSPFFCAAQVSK